MSALDPKALEALKNNQRQLDMDGVEVGVSRQALDELIAAYEATPPKGQAETLIARLWPNGFGPQSFDEIAVFIEEERKCDAEYRAAIVAAKGQAETVAADLIDRMEEAQSEVVYAANRLNDQSVSDAAQVIGEAIAALASPAPAGRAVEGE